MSARDDRKTRQLCAQIQRALSHYLSHETPDELLQNLYIESVEPAPDAGCVAVTLSVPADLDVERADVIARLAAVKPALRSEVARSIHRAKTPDLNFVVVRAG